MEYVWRLYGDVLPVFKFEDSSMVIPNYFGRDYRIPLSAEGVTPPSLLLKHYPFDVAGETVLDIGAWFGDTPLMWLYRGAKSVVAVEPEPLSFKYLKRNVEGLPVTCLNASLSIQIPKMPDKAGSGMYGLVDDIGHDLLDVPVVQLTELVEQYGASVVKLNCEGREHYVLEQLSQIPRLGVRKIAVQFHEIRGYDPYASLVFLRDKLGEYKVSMERVVKSLSGRMCRIVTVYWSL